jgi:hypothetical protein
MNADGYGWILSFVIYFGFSLDIDINVKVYATGVILPNQIFPITESNFVRDTGRGCGDK